MAEITGQGQQTAAGIMIGTGMLLTDASNNTSSSGSSSSSSSQPQQSSSSPPPMAPQQSQQAAPQQAASSGGVNSVGGSVGGYNGAAPAPPARALAIMGQGPPPTPYYPGAPAAYGPPGYHPGMPPHMGKSACHLLLHYPLLISHPSYYQLIN
jgi:hypothetical protein